MLKKILFFVFFLLTMSSFSQYYNDGQDRAGIRWKRISSINFEVIFPEGFEVQAEKVVHLMEKSYRYTTQTLNQQPKKISIILHTETVKSNAFLGWAPSRIEMYTTPHQDIYAQDWLEQLAIHEFRHMVQISKLETEMPKLLRYLFGEQAAALLTAMYVPFWFIEGDAVSAETGLSTVGRGRVADFHRDLRTQVLEKGIFSYDKAYLGSYKDHIANYYQLGYFMVGGARELYNETIWEDVLHNVARKPLSLRPFDRGLKKTIGLNKVQLYDTVFSVLKARWEKEDQQIHPSPKLIVTNESKYPTDYRFGFANTDSTFIAEKRSLSDINRFVEADQYGKEKVIFTPGYHFTESVSGKENHLVWVERLSHPRWYHSDRSLLRFYDTNLKELSEYTFNTKLFAPSFSPDLTKIVAVEGDNNYRFFLDIIDATNGEIVKQITTGDSDFLITPSWTNDGDHLLVVALRNNQKGILKVNIENGEVKVILPFRTQEISRPVEYDGLVYFIGGYTGIDNIYRLQSDGTIEAVISSRFGVADHAYRNGQVLYSNYTANGYQLAQTYLDSIQIQAVDLSSIQKKYPIAEKLAEQEQGPIDFTINDGITYSAQSYKKAAHLFDFHSWAPLSIDPYAQTVNPGVSVMSQNMLSTAEFVGGYRYYLSEKRGEVYANFKYLGWFPVIETEISSGNRDSYYLELQKYVNENNEVVKIDTIKKDFGWSETNFSVNTYLPLNLSKGKYYKRIQPRLKYKLSNINADATAYSGFPDGTYQTLETGVYMYQILQASEQDVLPNFGVMLDISYMTSLLGVADFGSLWAVSNVLYLPGLSKNHGITVYNGFQQKERMDYSFNDRVRFPRGHMHIQNDQLYSFGSDYELPLFYPDFSLWSLAYVKRLKLKLFYDFALYSGNIVMNNVNSTYNGKVQSTGMELTADAHFLRFIAPIEIGFRTSYLFDQKISFDYLFNIQFTF
ncbi:MAG: TolB family protein [Prolixibacteraceae bacterium]